MQIAAVNDIVDSNLATKPDVLNNANNALALHKVTCIQVVWFLTEPRVSSQSERSAAHPHKVPSFCIFERSLCNVDFPDKVFELS